MTHDLDMSGLDILVSDPSEDLSQERPQTGTRPLVKDISSQPTEPLEAVKTAQRRGRRAARIAAVAACSALAVCIGLQAGHIATRQMQEGGAVPVSALQPDEPPANSDVPADDGKPDAASKESAASEDKETKEKKAEEKPSSASEKSAESETISTASETSPEASAPQEQQPQQQADPHAGQTFVKERGHWENVEVSAAWDEPVYVDLPTVTCTVCGEIDEDPDEHMRRHADNGVSASCTVSNEQQEVDTIHHDAVYERRWVVDVPAHWE